jgi:hypothetical protein
MSQSAPTDNANLALNQPCLLKCSESAVFRDCFECARRQFDSHEAVQLRHPDPAGLQVRGEKPWGVGGDMLTDAAFFLGQAAPVNNVTLYRFGACDTALSSHDEISFCRAPKIRSFAGIVKMKFVLAYCCYELGFRNGDLH